ncbi:MAG: regulatory protein RecX [Candidatus Zixiibacteriota bacterium]
MTQLRLVRLKHTGTQVRITLSDSDDKLIISPECVAEFRLKEGIVLTESQANRLRAESDLYLCDQTALRLLAIREHTVGQLRTKLKRRRFDSNSIAEIIRKYRRSGLLDDERLSLMLAQRQLERRPCGRRVLIAYLRKRMIDRELAERAADQVMSGEDDVELAAAALRRRIDRMREFDLETARRKAYTYLSRCGFGYQTARSAFDALSEDWKEESSN